jgi:hypothetical protein
MKKRALVLTILIAVLLGSWSVGLASACGDACGPPATTVYVDIKPRSCPNPINVKNRGVLPVAILGTADFDAAFVDPASVRLAGVAPLRWAWEDVATPYGGPSEGGAYDCHTCGPDGFTDLTLKFDTQEVVAALGDVSRGDVLELTISGDLFDGIHFEAQDVVIIR